MPKYDGLAYPVDEKAEEAYDAAKERFEKLPKAVRHLGNFIGIYGEELKARGLPFVIMRGMEASDRHEAEDMLSGALYRIAPKLSGTRCIVAPRADEIIIDPPGEGGDETLGYIVLALGLAAAAVPVLWSLFAGRR
jgi:hypothetical protein